MINLTEIVQSQGIYLSPEQAERVMELFEEERQRHDEEIASLKLAHLDEIADLKLAHANEKLKIRDEHLETISKLEEGVDHFYEKYLEANKRYLEADKKCARWCLIAFAEWLMAIVVIIYHFIVC